jgi:hypothetical protein
LRGSEPHRPAQIFPRLRPPDDRRLERDGRSNADELAARPGGRRGARGCSRRARVADAAGAIHPYLGTAFQFLPREGTGADYLRNIHCFNLSARLSFGMSIGDIPSAVDHPRLVSAIARDLYLESVDTAAHERFINSPVTPPDPAPYQRAVQGRAL